MKFLQFSEAESRFQGAFKLNFPTGNLEILTSEFK